MKVRTIKKIAIYFIFILVISGNILAQTTINPGDVWMNHINPVWVGDEFIVEIHLNSGNNKLAAYGIELLYDISLIEANFNYGNMGVSVGPDGFLSAPSSLTPGEINVSGFDSTGKGPREDIYLLNIHFTAVSPGTSALDLVINDLTSIEIQAIGTPNGINSSVTILPAQEIGRAWLKHPYKVNYGMRSEVEIHFNSGEEILSGFRMFLNYNQNMLNVDTSRGSAGVSPGPDGFISAVSHTNGVVLITGFDSSGTGPGEDLHIATAHFRAIQTGSTQFSLVVDEASNDMALSIGTPIGMDSSIKIVNSYIRGDVNGDWTINIFDALFVAQYYVGFIPLIDLYAGDVNGDDAVNILDALLIAQYYVGAIDELPVNLNTPPVATDDSVTTVENESVLINVLANDTDVDGDTLSIDSVTQPSNGTAIIEDDAVRYTPDMAYNGSDTFTYTVSDGRGGTDSATVVVNISGICCPDYRAVDDSAETNEDTSVLIDVLANDTDMPPYTDYMNISSVSSPQNGTAEIVDNRILYTPNADFNGQDTFQYEGNDMNLSGTATVTVTVTTPPLYYEAIDDSVETPEDIPIIINVLANDLINENILIESASVPSNGSVVKTENLIEYTPDPGFNGFDSFIYTIGDGSGATDTATVTVTVLPVNDPPVAVDDVATFIDDLFVTIDVLANDTDIDGDTISIASVSEPEIGTAEIVGGQIVYTLIIDRYHGTIILTYIITDGYLTDQAEITLEIDIYDQPPHAQDDTATTNEDEAVTIDVLANDTDTEGDILSIDSVSNPANGTATTDGSTITYTPDTGFYGIDSFIYTITDGYNLVTATVTVTVTTSPPYYEAIDDSVETPEDIPIIINVCANDLIDENILIESASVPSNGSVVITENLIEYTPDPDFNGFDSFIYTIGDGSGATDTATATVTVTVLPVNDPPVAANDTAVVNSDTVATIDVLANDTHVSGDPIRLESVSQPTNGTVAIVLDKLEYTPNTDFIGIDSFTYIISEDYCGLTDKATVTVVIEP